MTDYKGMIRRRMGDALPESLVEAAETYTADFEVRGTYEPVTEQFGAFDETAGITGLYFPEDRLMLVDNRGSVHHNQQWNKIVDSLGVMSPVLPWASTNSFDGTYVVELGRSHGGLTQAINRGDHDGVTRLTTGGNITPEMVLDVAYAAQLTDHPPSITEYDVAFVPPEFMDLPDQVKRELRVKRRTFDMADVYDLLRTTPEGLPKPLFERGQL